MAMGVAEAKLFQNALGNGPSSGVGPGGGSTPRKPAPGGKKDLGSPTPQVKLKRLEQAKRFMG